MICKTAGDMPNSDNLRGDEQYLLVRNSILKPSNPMQYSGMPDKWSSERNIKVWQDATFEQIVIIGNNFVDACYNNYNEKYLKS